MPYSVHFFFMMDLLSVEEIYVKKTVLSYGPFKVIRIPHPRSLSSEQKEGVVARLRQDDETGYALDTIALQFALQKLQSRWPPHPSQALAEASSTASRRAQQKANIQNLACRNLTVYLSPACYANHPERQEAYRDAALYFWMFSYLFNENMWLSFGPQRQDWANFLDFQKKSRKNCSQPRALVDLEEKIRECRQRHSLSGAVHLRADPGEQTRLETWIEYEDYHLQQIEILENRATIIKNKIHECPELEMNKWEERLGAVDRLLQRRQMGVPWMEWQRAVLEAGILEDNDNEADTEMIEDSSLPRRSMRTESRSTLSSVASTGNPGTRPLREAAVHAQRVSARRTFKKKHPTLSSAVTRTRRGRESKQPSRFGHPV